MNISTTFCIILTGMVLAGCSTNPRAPLPSDPGTTRLPRLEKPAADIGVDGVEEMVLGADADKTWDSLSPKMLADDEPLPNIDIRRFAIDGVTLYQALRSLLDGTGISLQINLDAPSAALAKRQIYTVGVSGKLADILPNLSQTVGFWYRYSKGTLYVEPQRQFITSIPPVDTLFESVPAMLKTLGASDIFLDKSTRTLTYRATRHVSGEVDAYLKQLRERLALIVYDAYIWEVKLTDQSRLGVKWQEFPYLSGSAGQALTPQGVGYQFGGSERQMALGLTEGVTLAGSTGVGLVFSGKRFQMNTLIEFLNSQGTLNSLSNPRISMVSGSKMELASDEEITYISKIGAPTITGGTVVAGAAETATKTSGLRVVIAGDVSDGTVFSDVKISLSDPPQLPVTNVGGTPITLPRMATRKLGGLSRVRPNDVVILGGLFIDRVNHDTSGLPDGDGGVSVPTSRNKDVQRSELIIMLRPRVVKFVRKEKGDRND